MFLAPLKVPLIVLPDGVAEQFSPDVDDIAETTVIDEDEKFAGNVSVNVANAVWLIGFSPKFVITNRYWTVPFVPTVRGSLLNIPEVPAR